MGDYKDINMLKQYIAASVRIGSSYGSIGPREIADAVTATGPNLKRLKSSWAIALSGKIEPSNLEKKDEVRQLY